MSTKPDEPLTTASGSPIPVAPARVRAAQDLLTRSTYTQTRDALMAQFGISKSSAERDIKAAWALIAAEAEEERPFLRVRELERLNRVAAAAEADGSWSDVVKASAQIAKLTGLEAPTTVHMGVSREQQAMLAGLMLTPHERRRRLAERSDGEAEAGDDTE